MTNPEGYFNRKVEEAEAATERVKEQNKNISELVFKVTELEATIKRLESELEESQDRVTELELIVDADLALIEQYKPAYFLLKNIKEIEI